MDANRTPSDAMPLSLADAAAQLGISPDAARKRLERGTIQGEKRSGRWVVYLEPDATASAHQDATWMPVDAGDDGFVADAVRELVETLRSENRFLRDELANRSEEIRRRDHIIAGLVERVRELPAGETTQHAAAMQEKAALRDDRADMASESMTPASDSMALHWRAWWRRMRGER
jgi:predicted ArsR family transcriptional regulator